MSDSRAGGGNGPSPTHPEIRHDMQVSPINGQGEGDGTGPSPTTPLFLGWQHEHFVLSQKNSSGLLYETDKEELAVYFTVLLKETGLPHPLPVFLYCRGELPVLYL